MLRASAAAPQTDALLARVNADEPFAVYLRSFSSEHLQYLETPILGGSEYELPIEYEIVERDFDAALTECADDVILGRWTSARARADCVVSGDRHLPVVAQPPRLD